MDKQLKDTQIKGLTGLSNLGNTCFLNSCMQILSNTPELTKIILSNDEQVEKTSSSTTSKSVKLDCTLLQEWNALRELMWSKNCVISPGGFLNSVQLIARQKDKDLFTGYAQNDAPEFLMFILDSFHIALSSKVNVNLSGTIKNSTDKLAKKCFGMIKTMYEKEYSPLLELFYCVSVSIISNEKGKMLSITPEPMMILNLPIPTPTPNGDDLTLESCFDQYCKREHLDGDNRWRNDKTGNLEEVDKGILFWSLPNILIIDLKRFTNTGKKRQELVNIPLTNIDLSAYIVGYKQSSYKYNLYGVCNHSGGTMGGHYTATILKEDGKWYNYNDTNVTHVQDRRVISSKAYCLFLKKTI